MAKFFGYIGTLVGGGLWIITLLAVVVMVIIGLVYYVNRKTIEDPGEADPEVISGTAPPLGRGEMSRFEAGSVKPSLPMLIFALAMLLTVVGFGAYGLKEMAAGTKTTARMRQEAKAQAKETKEKYGTTGPVIEDEGDTSREKRRTKAFDIDTKSEKKPAPPMKHEGKKKHKKGKRHR